MDSVVVVPGQGEEMERWLSREVVLMIRLVFEVKACWAAAVTLTSAR